MANLHHWRAYPSILIFLAQHQEKTKRKVKDKKLNQTMSLVDIVFLSFR